MSFPLFSDFGKSAKDLFEKKFVKDADKGGFELTSKRNAGDITAETSIKAVKDNLNSNLKLTQKFGFGQCEVDVNVDGKAKGTVTFDKAVDKLTLKIAANSAKNDKDPFQSSRAAAQDADKPAAYVPKPFATVQADYKADGFNFSTTINANGSNGAFVDVSAVAGKDNLAVGGSAKLALGVQDTVTKTDTETVQDYAAGLQYSSSGYTAGFSTQAKFNQFSLSYFQTLAKDYSVGSKFEWNKALKDPAGLVTLGSSYKPSSDSVFKLKAAVGKEQKKGNNVFNVTAYYEQSFSSPAVKVGVTAEVDVLKSITNPVYSFAAALGDN